MQGKGRRINGGAAIRCHAQTSGVYLVVMRKTGMENILNKDKVNILLNLLESQFSELRRSEEREQVVFQWTTSLLLVSFGALIALSDRSIPLQHPLAIKLLASICSLFQLHSLLYG
jgi:hypothetical protein